MTTPAYSSRRNTERRSISNVGLGTTGLSHTVGHIDDTRAAVVIELGRVTTKCGYAGDYTPRRICRTEYFDENGIVRQDVLDGYENAKRPNDAALQRFFKLLYFTHLLVEPRERRVVLVENILYPTEFRHALCRVLMDKMDVPSVLFLPSHLCATFPFNTENALVLELGFKESLVIPVALGVSLLNSHEISSIAEKRLQERLAELLLAHGTITGHHDDSRRISEEDMMKIRERNLLEDICTRLLFCSSRERGLLIQEKAHKAELDNPKPRDANVNLDGETLVIPGFIREAACEVFFVNDSPDEPALPHLIFNAIMKVPIDLRRQMFSSLLVSGGPALRLGFLGRLKEELLALGVEMKQKAANTIKFHRFQNEPGTELYLNWLGGAMFGSIRDALACRSVSRELWQEKHRIPDWTDFVQYNVRSGRTDMQG